MSKKQDEIINKRAVAGVFNFAPHYRSPIFRAMAEQLQMDLYFGDRVLTPIKPLEHNSISRFKKILPPRYFKRFYYNRGFIRLLLSGKYPVIVLTGEIKNLSAWMALFFKCIRPNLKICLWTHGPYGSEKGFSAKVGKLMYRMADHLFLYGDYARTQLLALGIPDAKISVVYNSLDYNKQVEIRKTLEVSSTYPDYFNNSNPTLVYVGRIQKVKQIDLLVEAVALLYSQGNPVNLVIIGDGQDKEQLESLVGKLGIATNVWFMGASYDEAVLSQRLFDADVCVSPGNVGLTAIHALTYGCPVITHNQFDKQMPEFEAIAEGVTGAFFVKDDVENLAKTIKEWLKKSNNTDFRNEVRYSCYAVIDLKYNPNAQIKTFDKALTALQTNNK